MAFTYDVTTNRGKVRLLIGDTNASSYVFEDLEVDTFLSLASNSVFVGSAIALETIIRDRGVRLQKKVELGGYKTEEFALDELRKLAKDLRDSELKGTLQTGSIELSKEHLESFRPDWVDETGLAVNE